MALMMAIVVIVMVAIAIAIPATIAVVMMMPAHVDLLTTSWKNFAVADLLFGDAH